MPEMSRRAFFRGRLKPSDAALLPPWANPDFHDICTRCKDCAQACPENIIKPGEGGYPNVDFNLGECTLCHECEKSCESNALDAKTTRVPWNQHASITIDSCLSANSVVCRSCSEICDQRAITFQLYSGSRSEPKIDTNLCNGCGACVGPCPANAISIRKSV